MAAGRFIVGPYFPARDRDGQLQAGALLYVYENGTTTKATIYTDEGLTVLSPNPVVANSSGQFPAVWGEAGSEADPVPYTVQITASDGASLGNPSTFDDFYPSLNWENASITLAEAAAVAAEASADDASTSAAEAEASALIAAEALADIEQIAADAPEAPSIANKANLNGGNILGANIAAFRTAIGAVSLTALAASAGAALVGWIQSGLNAVARTVASKLQDTISVKDFGATGDDSTNDRAAIQAAITAVATAGGGNVIVPYGIYRVGSGLDVPANVGFLMDAGAVLKPTADFDVIRQHARSTVKAKVDTTATTFTSAVLLLDGNDEASAATAFRLHVPTVFDLDIKGAINTSTGTAVKLKCTTTNARIMGVQGNLKQLGLAKGFDLELNATDGSNFITGCDFTFESSEVLEMIKFNPGSGGIYHLDRNRFYGSAQPRTGTTLPLYTLGGQYNNFNILAWDWDTVVGTSPYAFVILTGARQSLLQTVVTPAYVNKVSTEQSFVIWNYDPTAGFSAVQTGLIRGPTGSGNLVDDVPNGTGLRIWRLNGTNFMIGNVSRHLEFYGNSGNPAVFRNINLTATRNYDLLNVAGSIPIVTAVPATAASAGVAGQIAFDASYAYFCTAANTWVRAPVATW